MVVVNIRYVYKDNFSGEGSRIIERILKKVVDIGFKIIFIGKVGKVRVFVEF